MKLTKIKESIDKKVELTEKAQFLEEVSKFNEYGSRIYRTEDLREAAKAISKIVRMQKRLHCKRLMSGLMRSP